MDKTYTIDDVYKYAKEKRIPQKDLNIYIKKLNTKFPDGKIDALTFQLITVSIETAARDYDIMRNILKKHREEREKQKSGQ